MLRLWSDTPSPGGIGLILLVLVDNGTMGVLTGACGCGRMIADLAEEPPRPMVACPASG